MARTLLFRTVKRALGASGAPFGPRALSRRHFLVTGAALAACARAPVDADIAIIGAGAAGLTAAYRLDQAGRRVTLYDAAERYGGRMFTRRDFNEDGQFCELGGELVDTGHEALRALAGELGVAIERVAPEVGEELFHIEGRLYATHDMLGPDGAGAFARLAGAIARDQNALYGEDDDWTARARELDAISIADYLKGISDLAPSWALKLLDIAYFGEFGLPTSEQSALNLVDLIGTDTAQGFQVFGDSDEAWRIAGGSSSLPEALAAKLSPGVTPRLGHRLVNAARAGAGLRLGFATDDGAKAFNHSHVIFALPFTLLRGVAGIDGLGLSEQKRAAIAELGYGKNAKLMVSTKSRPWNDPARRFPAPTLGVFYSDQCQLVWETSRAQPGERGVLTNFLAGQHDRASALAAMQAGLGAIAAPIAESLDPSRSAWMDWVSQPFALGSYASARVGQYTRLLEVAGAPSDDGRIHFAGEHTSPEYLGFMNGAVETGEAAAKALLGD